MECIEAPYQLNHIYIINFGGHVYVSGTSENKNSKLVVLCLKHGKNHETTYTNYERCRNVTPCCGWEKVSNKLKQRKFSLETKKQMSISASKRKNVKM